MRRVALALLLALPAAAPASDCGTEAQSFAEAYKAYNDCSAAGRGAAGCAAVTRAYDAARAQLDACREQRRANSRPAWESDPRPDRDYDRDAWVREREPEPFKAPRATRR